MNQTFPNSNTMRVSQNYPTSQNQNHVFRTKLISNQSRCSLSSGSECSMGISRALHAMLNKKEKKKASTHA